MSEEIDWLKQMAEEGMEDLRSSLKQIREDPTTKWDFPWAISRETEVIAIKKIIVDRDVIAFKQMAYTIAKCYEAIFLAEPYNTEESPRYTKPYSYICTNKIEVLSWALVSQHKPLIESLAHLMGYKGEEWELKQGVGREGVALTFATKYLILNEDSKAEPYLQYLQKRKLQKYRKAYVDLTQAIWERDRDKTQAALAAAVKRKTLIDLPFHNICKIPLMGYGCLARMRGLDVSIDHSTVPGEVFESHLMEYPDPDFLFPEVRDKTWQDLLEKRYP